MGRLALDQLRARLFGWDFDLFHVEVTREVGFSRGARPIDPLDILPCIALGGMIRHGRRSDPNCEA